MASPRQRQKRRQKQKRKAVLNVWTDGACRDNPGPGGWGVVLVGAHGERRELSGSKAQTTNNEMEMQAVLEALRIVPDRTVVDVYSDSKSVVNGLTFWVDGWKKSGWTTKAGTPVKHRELWESLARERERVNLKMRWVQGHAGNENNERADELAQRAIRDLLG